MKLLTFLAVFGLLFTLSGCPKKKAEESGETSSEPVEGSSSPASEKSSDSPGDEMQEKKPGPGEAGSAGDSGASEEKKAE